MSNEPEPDPESERILKRQGRVDLTTAVADDDDEEVHPFGQGDIDDITAPTQPQGAATGDIGAKQQSLIQKCKIFLELLNDPAVNDNKPILSDNAESNIATLSAEPPEDANVITKTLMIKSMAELLDLNFSRIQFTPDLMPSDIIGNDILNQNKEFKFIKGPIFCNVLLADEINRTPPKTQSALLEAMEEKAVTVSGETYKMSLPFFVLATQNPIDQEGTYPLPEAQVDRFMLKVKISHPERAEERQILDLMSSTNTTPETQQAISMDDIRKAREIINNIYIDDKVKDYIVDMICCTRQPSKYEIDISDFIQLGASPRATVALTLSAKSHAFLRGRGFVTPQDVKSVALDVLRHRVSVTFEAEAEEKSSEIIIQKILDELPVP